MAHNPGARKEPMKYVIAWLLSASLSCAAAAAGLRIYTEDSPPLNYVKDGRLDGASVAIVRAIQARVGDTSSIEVLPWARAYRALENEKNVALFSTTRTEQREDLFKWVGPIGHVNWVFVKKRGSPVHIETVDDARSVGAIGTYNQDAREQWLKSLGFANLQSVTTDSVNCRKLLAGRIDVWLTGDIDMNAICHEQGIDLAELEIAYVAKRQDLYLAFSKATPDATVHQWQEAFDALVRDGSFKAIHRKYGVLAY
jgi:polar amino acid transport system substrate-binding protein